MSCCYLQETWAVIFGWVELSAPRSMVLFKCTGLWVADGETHGDMNEHETEAEI